MSFSRSLMCKHKYSHQLSSSVSLQQFECWWEQDAVLYTLLPLFFCPVITCKTPQWLHSSICSPNATIIIHLKYCYALFIVLAGQKAFGKHIWTRAKNYLSLWRFFHQVGPLSRGCSGPAYPISKHFSLSSCSSPKNCASKQTNASLVSMKTSWGCSLLPCVAILLKTQFESHFFFFKQSWTKLGCSKLVVYFQQQKSDVNCLAHVLKNLEENSQTMKWWR